MAKKTRYQIYNTDDSKPLFDNGIREAFQRDPGNYYRTCTGFYVTVAYHFNFAICNFGTRAIEL